MECKVTCFDRVMHLVEELPKDKHKEVVEIIQKYSFIDFLDFCVENNCFTEAQSNTLYDGIVMWEDLDGNYYEEDYDKLHELYDKVGITEEVFSQFKDTTFTAFIYEDDGIIAADLSTYDDKEEAIEFAKFHNWDEVVNDITGEVIWRR